MQTAFSAHRASTGHMRLAGIALAFAALCVFGLLWPASAFADETVGEGASAIAGGSSDEGAPTGADGLAAGAIDDEGDDGDGGDPEDGNGAGDDESPGEAAPVEKRSLAGARVVVGDQTYTGSALEPAVAVYLNGSALQQGSDFKTSYAGNVGAGTAQVLVEGTGAYTGSVRATFQIQRAEQPMTASGLFSQYKIAKRMKRRHTLVVYNPVSVEEAKGPVTYSNVSTTIAGRLVTVNRSSGNLIVPRSVQKRKFRLAVRVAAEGDANHAAGESTVSMVFKPSLRSTALAQVALNEWRRGELDGTHNRGGERYWSLWYKEHPKWCSEFAGWCCLRAGLTLGKNMPIRPVNAPRYYRFYKANPKYGKVRVAKRVKPKVGDIALSYGKGTWLNHTGIVVKLEKDGFRTVEGNVGDKVVMKKYPYKNTKWKYYVHVKG